jgi:hypothetical protein
MKRSITSIGVGLALLVGASGAFVLFPNTVGAHTSLAPTKHALTTSSQAKAVRSLAVSHSAIHTTSTGASTRTTGSARQVTRLHSLRTSARGIGTRSHRGTSAMRYSGGAGQTAYAGTGHSCPHMGTSGSQTHTSTGK